MAYRAAHDLHVRPVAGLAPVPVPAESLTDRFVQDLGSLIRRLADERPVNRIPSLMECRFCDISAKVCPERMEHDAVREEGATSDF